MAKGTSVKLTYSQIFFALAVVFALLSLGLRELALSATGLAITKNSPEPIPDAKNILYYSTALTVIIAGLGFVFRDKLHLVEIKPRSGRR